MEVLPKNRLLKFHTNTLQDVRKSINLDKPGEMKEAVNILEEWMKQQNHFTYKDFDRHYLEMTIVVSKGSLERAKSRLDKTCTLKNLMSHVFQEHDMRKDFAEDLKDMTHALLPKMTKDHCRVYIMRSTGKKFTPTVFLSFVRNTLMFAEYLRRYDYAAANHVVFDLTDCNLMELLPKLYLNELQQFVNMLIEGYGFRVKGIHMLTQSKMIDILVTIVKQLMSAKIGGRIQVHKHVESIIEIVGKDVLPVEYGGDEKSIDKLHEEWMDVLTSEDYLKYQRIMNVAKTDESLRTKDKFNEQYIGMPGTFRTLTVD